MQGKALAAKASGTFEAISSPALKYAASNRQNGEFGRKAGLVSAQRGTKGGYSLARPASEIRLNEVIRILDEDTVDRFCKTHAGVLDACIHTSDCGIRPVIVGLHEVVQNALSEITLAQLVGTEEKVDARLHQIVKLQSQLRPMRSAN